MSRGRAETIARVANELLGDRNKTPLADIRDAMTERLRTEEVVLATSANKVQDAITGALAAGVHLRTGGQDVRIRAVKPHAHRSARWWIVRESDLATAASPRFTAASPGEA